MIFVEIVCKCVLICRCSAMNRDILNVIFGGFNTVAKVVKEGEEEPKVNKRCLRNTYNKIQICFNFSNNWLLIYEQKLFSFSYIRSILKLRLWKWRSCCLKPRRFWLFLVTVNFIQNHFLRFYSKTNLHSEKCVSGVLYLNNRYGGRTCPSWSGFYC